MGKKQITRRDLMRLGVFTGAGIAAAGVASSQVLTGGVCIDATPILNIDNAVNLACGVGLEAYPTSPLIVKPFIDPMPLGDLNPAADPTKRRSFAAGYRAVAGEAEWTVRQKNGVNGTFVSVPGPQPGAQDSIGERGNGLGLPKAGTHQLYPKVATRWDGNPAPQGIIDSPLPIFYHLRLKLGQHSVTTSPVLPLGLKKNGTIGAIALPALVTATKQGSDTVLKSGLPTYTLPKTTIYGFDGSFPGPMINAEYGQPVIVRFENDLDKNDACLPRYDYGAPDWAFLTHLHNGHTAPESDGNPHHMADNGGGYQTRQWCDNLYLNYPAGGDEREKQSFLWFHDHRMHHTGANVYKGLIGLMPHYDPILDSGDETKKNADGTATPWSLPGVRKNYTKQVPNPDPFGAPLTVPDGFDVDYDIPMAFYDCIMDDAVTPHFDNHQPTGLCGQTHPEWWGHRFFRHYPNSGFVGDVFTVNGVAFPELKVRARRYRFRWLGASIARCYELSFRTAPVGDVGFGMGNEGIGAFPGLQGQWNFATKAKNGVVSRVPGTLLKNGTNPFMLQIASEGGLLEKPIFRDSIQIWPAKRREVVVDFSGFKPGTVLYLVNSLPQLDGKKPTFPGKGFDPNYAVPLVRIVVGEKSQDDSSPIAELATKTLRKLPLRLSNIAQTPVFNLKNGNPLNPTGAGSGETKWLVNDMEFDYRTALHTVTEGLPEHWTVANLSGGWIHPFHMHQEEHQILSRDSVLNPHPEDQFGKEDVLGLDPGETITFYRNFRTFNGKYVAHCHNLAHEDHNMMFGWTIRPALPPKA